MDYTPVILLRFTTMEWLRTSLAVSWIHISTSLSLQIFLLSSLLLLCGMVLIVWMRACRLSFLNTTSIKEIEFTHPHLPSLQVIVAIFLCSASLLTVVLQTVSGLPPFAGPFEWIYLAAFFVLSGALGILAELRSRGSRDIIFAVIIGTSIAFLFLVFKYAVGLQGPGHVIALLLLLLLSVALAWRIFVRRWTGTTQSLSVATFVLWIALYLFR